MTKKDFQLIADAIACNRNRETGADVLYFVALNDVSFEFARVLAQTNPRFDRNRFLKACGIEE